MTSRATLASPRWGRIDQTPDTTLSQPAKLCKPSNALFGLRHYVVGPVADVFD